MRRRKILLTAGALLTLPITIVAQQSAKLRRIGFLGATSPAGGASWVEALRAGLGEFGYVEGKNITIEFRWANGNYDRLGELAGELVNSKVEVILTHGTPGTRAAKQATRTIPIVMGSSGDAVASGLVASLGMPGGNITGLTYFIRDFMGKRLELLKEVRRECRDWRFC